MTVGSTPPVNFQGLGTGLNTSAIINAYLSLDEGPLADLENQQSNLKTQVTALQTIQTQLQGLQSAADAIASPGALAQDVQATSSSQSVASATTGAGATTGSSTFSVQQLATANTLISSGTVAATSDVVASGSLLVAAGGSGIGIANLAGGSGLATGTHTIAVTQSSAGASVTGSSPLSSSVLINASNDQLDVTLNGTGENYAIASGTYTTAQLAIAIASASSGALIASVNSSGALVLSSANQGSTASVSVGSGSANATLALSNGQSGTGTDGVITVDGTANTVSSIAGSGTTTVTLNSGTGGTVQAQLNAGGLSLGSVSANNVSVGNGSLASVVAAINAANAGVSAQAITLGQNQYALEVASSETGAANDVTIDPRAFSSSSLGTLTTTTAGQNALVDLGGPGGFAVSSQSNTLTGLLPGVSISLQSSSAAPVTISVTANGAAAANAVQTFVTAANTVLQSIATDIAYDPTTNTAGPLNGNYALESLSQSILSQVGDAIGSSSAIDSSLVGSAAGLSLSSSGQINFDAQTFANDFNADPASIESLFSAGGSYTPAAPASPGDVQFAFSSDLTQSGNYAVTISRSAAQASDLGTVGFASSSSTVGSATTYSVQAGSAVANYAVGSGESLSAIVAGLNTAFAQQGLALSAQAVTSSGNTSVEITSDQYGSNQSFTVSSSSGDVLGIASASPFSGTDVAGTINGVTASGSGQILSAPVSDPTLAGLGLSIATPNIASSTAIGSFLYAPGIAQSLATVAATNLVPGAGLLPTSISSLQNTLQGVGSEITSQQQLLTEQQTALTAEYNNLSTTLSSLQSESSFLTSALGGTSSNLLSALQNAQQNLSSGG